MIQPTNILANSSPRLSTSSWQEMGEDQVVCSRGGVAIDELDTVIVECSPRLIRSLADSCSRFSAWSEIQRKLKVQAPYRACTVAYSRKR